MAWWQALIIALSTLIVTKTLDHIIAVHSEKRDFNKVRRELAHNEIEELKNDVGAIYELAVNWGAFKNKEDEYIGKFSNDHILVGKFNKYPGISQAARDTVHWCKIVAYNEREHADELIENKKALGEKFKIFIHACDEYLDNLV